MANAEQNKRNAAFLAMEDGGLDAYLKAHPEERPIDRIEEIRLLKEENARLRELLRIATASAED